MSIDALPFEHSEEAFDERIDSAAANAAHAAFHDVALQEALVISARELTATIGMQHQR